MAVRVTIAKEKDAGIISSIGLQSFYDAFHSIFEKNEDLEKYQEYTYETNKIRKSISKENNVFFIAWIDNKPVGFAKVKKFSLNALFESVAQMELQKIYVLFEYHSSGAGQALMNSVLELAEELRPDLVWLDVHIQNSRATRFYEKNHFRKTGKHFFDIGSQTFEYDVMIYPVSIIESIAIKSLNQIPWTHLRTSSSRDQGTAGSMK